MPDFILTADQEKIKHAARDFALKDVLPSSWYYDEMDYDNILNGTKFWRCRISGHIHYGDESMEFHCS